MKNKKIKYLGFKNKFNKLNPPMSLYQFECEDGYQWIVKFPHLEGCCGGGTSAIKAIDSAQENVRFYLDCLEFYGVKTVVDYDNPTKMLSDAFEYFKNGNGIYVKCDIIPTIDMPNPSKNSKLKHSYRDYPFDLFASGDGRAEWVCKFVGIDGCIGCGNTPQKAMIEGYSNLKFHLESLVELGLGIPELIDGDELMKMMRMENKKKKRGDRIV